MFFVGGQANMERRHKRSVARAKKGAAVLPLETAKVLEIQTGVGSDDEMDC